MRRCEADSDHEAAPGSFVVVRLAGRGFGKLLRARHDVDRPLDVRVRDSLIATTDHLMNCGVPVGFAHTHSDEITLLLGQLPAGERGLAAVAAGLAGQASARCTLLLGALACFGARVAELPDEQAVVDYFAWRQAEAAQAAVMAHGVWALQQYGTDEAAARARLAAASEAELAVLLGELEIDPDALPVWQTRGVGLGWERPETTVNLRTGAPVTLARRIRVLLELPAGDTFATMVRAQARQVAAPARQIPAATITAG